MASIRKRGSNSYLIVVSRGYDYEGNRLKSVQKTVKPPKEYTPKQAEKWVKEQAILFEREVQHTPEPINRSITLAKYIEHWAADIGPKKLADSTYQRDLQDVRRILPALGNYKLTDLRKEVIRDFYEEMRHSPRLDGRGNLSEKSVEGLHNTLCGILSAAVDEGYLTHNPAWRCYKPKGQKKERPVADEETVKKLITAFEGQSMKYETYFKLVLATGLRRGEACGLKWSDINWRKRTIHVQRGVVKLSHQESITKDPKTSSGDRMVYLSKEMCQLLKAWRKECEWDRQQTANETVDEDDYLFRQPNGKPMNPCTFTYRFKLILKANNLPLDLNVHSLRHTNASLLISQGVDVRTVASLLGHAQASTTLDIYAHMEIRKEERKDWTRAGQNRGTSQDLKAVSEALSYLRQKGLSTVEDLEAFLESSGKSAADYRNQMKPKEARSKVIDGILASRTDCKECKAVYEKYQKIFFKKIKGKFKQEHPEVARYEKAADYLAKHPDDKDKTKNELQQEQETLLSEIAELKVPLTEVQEDLKKLRDIRYWVRKATPGTEESKEPPKKQPIKEVLQDKTDEKKAQRTAPAQEKHRQQDMEL